MAKLLEPGLLLRLLLRGPSAAIGEHALVDALRTGGLAAAGLDVFAAEPIPADNPLLGLDNVIAGSHNGSNTAEAVARTTRAAVDNLITGLGLVGS